MARVTVGPAVPRDLEGAALVSLAVFERFFFFFN